MSLDGKKASQDEIELSISLSGVKGQHRRVSTYVSIPVCVELKIERNVLICEHIWKKNIHSLVDASGTVVKAEKALKHDVIV